LILRALLGESRLELSSSSLLRGANRFFIRGALRAKRVQLSLVPRHHVVALALHAADDAP
jgi:hypothetical protein